jgi:nucleotide-binding universal stress UspA family protein
VTTLSASTSTDASQSSLTTLAPLGGEQRLFAHPQAVRGAIVIHDGTREAEVLGQWWATCFGGAVATFEAPACGAPRSGLDAEWVARIEEIGADLIVLARDTRSGLRGPSGLSEYLLEQLDVPVLACGAESVCPRQLRAILAPVDVTGEGTAALPLVLTLARALQAEVVLLHAVEFSTASVAGLPDSDAELHAFDHALQQLEQLKLAFQLCGVSTKAVVQPGPVVASVAALAKTIDADLLAMPTRARTGAARSFHGRIAGAIARMVPQPILWVPTR